MGIYRRIFFVLVISVVVAACHSKKQLATAKANATGYGLARCECEKLSRQDPPGDLTKCTESMLQAQRYLKINLEFGKFSTAEQNEIQKSAEKAFEDCMKP